ncbi:hypothetical protein ACQP2F_06670 [Actinoplanes sp. CA-030573]|uniref:hypothetical protein n=1 Tax=Actinoplanes sp. CA-030573 TaxID=3239898 RepID=UPI003D8CEF2F
MIHDAGSRCTLCDRLVLGLAGHDWTALPWMIAAGSGVPPGPCHVRCLEELGCGWAWAGAVENYHRIRWPFWLGGVEGGVRWRLHGSRSARRFHLWRSDGLLISFPYASTAAHPGRIRTELAEVGTAHAAALLTAMGTDEPAIAVPLTSMTTALGVADRYPRVAGTVTRDRAGAADLVTARHRLTLTPAVVRTARRMLPSGG